MEKQFTFPGIRKDLEDFFRISGIRQVQERKHNAILVIDEKNKTITVEKSPERLISGAYDEDTDVLCQWPGKFRSDFFKFTIKEFKDYIAQNPKNTTEII